MQTVPVEFCERVLHEREDEQFEEQTVIREGNLAL
jgi:hypothetical protein